ncbi:hypothetical protein FH608_025895 [Nonomuraea phyllanthi]|uniref:Uncharacterized protein n=1 Tax=Nonomuraea phyllanthi TaxID=2219224 RepID=A0A5C4W8A8_9ACTN|nr:hypothetical protein [Nonomuraea phyllanthi]KAB8192143.1 hypothetical protein FH608_025895 [Nonomuraea phyllanthi]
MIAVVVSLVAVVLLVLVVVALGMRSMNRRESSLPPERLKEMAEKEEMTHTRSTDEFSKHEPRMANFSPDFSPIGEPKPKPVRTGQRGRRGVDEWGNPTTDDDDEEFWANIRSDAEEGGFGAGGTVAARKGASRPVERERPAEQPTERPAAERPAAERPAAERPAAERRSSERPAAERRSSERPAAKRRSRAAQPQPAAASAVDPDATTVQGPLPQRQPAAAAANLADLVEPAPGRRETKRTPSQAELADQRTVTFAAPAGDVMSILGAGAQPVPSPRPDSLSSNNSRSGTGSFPATSGSFPATPAARPAPVSQPASLSQPAGQPAPASRQSPLSAPTGGSYGSGAHSATPAAHGSGSFPAGPAAHGSGSFPATPAANTSGSFPAQPASLHGAPTSDPFPAYTNAAETTWTDRPAASSAASSGAWPAQPDILDDPAPAPSYGSGSSWPAFEQPAARSSYPASYEVRAGWAVADDSDALTGPSPATGAPTAPGRVVSANDDVLSAPTPQPSSFAYETGDITTSSAAWPEPPSSATSWPAYGSDNGKGGSHRRSSDQDHPHDYYR